MNDRIQELAEQANDYATETVEYYRCEGFEYKNELYKVSMEKFAELIVRECLEMMGQAEDDAYHCFEPSERPTEYIEWLRDWQERFTKHFGVE